MAKASTKIDSISYQELLDAFKKLAEDPFPVRIDHSSGRDLVDTVRVTGHNKMRVRLFRELAHEAINLFEIPSYGSKLDMWIRLVIEHVPSLVERDASFGGRVMLFEHIHNAAEASVIAMRRLYAIIQKNRETNREDKSEEGNRKRRPNRDEDQVMFDDCLIVWYLLKNPHAKRDEVSDATDIAKGTVSESKAWKEHLKQKREIRKANKAVSVKDMDSLSS